MSEKRSDARRDLTYRCWIVPDGDQEMIVCRMHNASKSGARLSVAGSMTVPDEFTLALTKDLLVTRRCRIVWSDGELFGIKFVTESAETRKPYF